MRHMIEGIPPVAGRPEYVATWGPLRALALLIQHRYAQTGREELVLPETLFEAIYDMSATEFQLQGECLPRINMAHLAQVAPKFVDCRVRLMHHGMYDHPRLAAAGWTPQKLLRAYVRRNRPCLVRLGGGYYVVAGYDDEAVPSQVQGTLGVCLNDGVIDDSRPGIYYIHLPAGGIRGCLYGAFEGWWADGGVSSGQGSGPELDLRHLMLVLTPR